MLRTLSCLVFLCIIGATQCQELECTHELDVVFLVDESGSICDYDNSTDPNNRAAGCDNFRWVKGFMYDVVQRLDVSSEGVHIALVSFSDGARIRWNLCGYPTKSELSSAILDLPYEGGNTHTGVGCLKAASNVLCPGCCGNRPRIRDVVIVITDGNPTPHLPWEAQCLDLQSQAIVFAVGIADVNPTNLAKLSSDPKQLGTNYFTSTGFRSLPAILDSLVQRTCETRELPPVSINCTTSIIDLMFIVDLSGSICDNRQVTTCGNFELLKAFMSSAINRLTVGPDNARVSIVTFSGRVHSSIDFCRFQDRSSASRFIADIPYADGQTFTELACQAGSQQFCATSGAISPCCDRGNVRDVVIILTDGVPTNADLYKVDCGRLQNQIKTVIAVGIGNVNETILKDLSSEPKELHRNYFTTPNFIELDNILDNLLAQTCEVPEVYCRQPADVLFIVDVSGSIGSKNFDVIEHALNTMVGVFGVNSPTGVRAAIISFSTNARVECYLSQSRDIYDCIHKLRWNPRGTTNTAEAFEMAANMVFTTANGDRADVNNICIILTDGESNSKDQTLRSAIEAKKSMTLYVVGLGSWLDENELKAIANQPHNLYYRHINDLGDLGGTEFLTSLLTFTCNNKDNCNPNPCENGGQCVDKPGRHECLCQQNYGGPECQYFCRTPCYLSLAIDSSGSIGEDNFNLVMDFARDLVGDLPVGSGMSVSLLTFDTSVTKYFDLRDYNTRAGTVNGMGIPYHSGGTTNTAGALEYMRSNMYSRENVPNSEIDRCGLVITDGRSNEPFQTWAEAISTRKADIFLSAIGVGSNINEDELRAIVSDPTEMNYYNVMRYDNLLNIKDDLRMAICNANNDCNPNPCRNGGVCEDRINGYICICPPTATGPNCERACGGQMDLLLIIDRSGSIRQERFIDVQQAIARYLKSLEISPTKTRVAGVSFSDDASIDFYFDTYTKSQDIIEAVYKLQYTGGKTNIAEALEIGCNQVFGSRGDRRDVYDHVLLFSDGGANIRAEDTTQMAINCKVSGKQMTVAAVGRDLNIIQLNGIASEPVERNVATVPSFDNIMDMVAPMVAMTCNDINDCRPNPCRNGGNCIDRMWTYQCVCNFNTGRNCERGPCRSRLDVVLIMDISGSVEEVCVLGMSVVRAIIYGLDYQGGRAKVALITYSDNAAVSFYLDQYSDQTDYLMAIVCDRRGGRTNTAAALDLAYDSVLVGNRGDRSGAPNRVVLLTDGGSNINRQNTINNANRLKNKADICVFGIGEQIDMGEVNAIAAPRDGFSTPCVHLVRDISQATNAADRFLQSVCG